MRNHYELQLQLWNTYLTFLFIQPFDRKSSAVLKSCIKTQLELTWFPSREINGTSLMSIEGPQILLYQFLHLGSWAFLSVTELLCVVCQVLGAVRLDELLYNWISSILLPLTYLCLNETEFA